MKSALFIRYVVALLATVLTSSYCSFVQAREGGTMTAHFINVGQADASLLEFPCGAVLIDAGSQDEFYKQKLLTYLDKFFIRRADLNRTLDLVIVTHAHLDHNTALKDITQRYYIRHYIDNGLRAGSGRVNQNWLQDNSAGMQIAYASYSFDQIHDRHLLTGLTDTLIDPVNCSGTDPRITILSGTFRAKPAGWSATDLKNGNNHSLAVKVEYGKASFLFTGDMETAAMNEVVNYYSSCSILDIDVLRVGHHGAANATTEAYLRAVTPMYAVISCGRWDYGLHPKTKNSFNTYSYGHPRAYSISMIANAITEYRVPDITVKAGLKARKFAPMLIDKAIYATTWDGNIRINATSEGLYTVTIRN